MEELSFRDMVTKESLRNPKTNNFLVWMYKWWTTLTLKKLMLSKNWDETKDAINEWLEMDRDLGMAVNGKVMDDELRNDVQEIKNAIEMMNDKIKAKEIK